MRAPLNESRRREPFNIRFQPRADGWAGSPGVGLSSSDLRSAPVGLEKRREVEGRRLRGGGSTSCRSQAAGSFDHSRFTGNDPGDKI